MRKAFETLGLTDSGSQRALLQRLSDAGAFDLAQVAHSLRLLPPSAPDAPVQSPNMAEMPYVMLEPAKVQVDAATYQFRSGSDANGVTSLGKIQAENWNPILHGDPILVHERLDGRLMLADGHHRLDLAKRLNAEGKGPAKIAAQVLREADGFTPLDVKIIAAYKNIAFGHTNPIDAARVFKVAKSGKVHAEFLPQLPMDKGNIRVAYRLSGLSDAVLDKVEKTGMPAEIGAEIADRVSDPARQDAVFELVAQKITQQYKSELPFNLSNEQRNAQQAGGFADKLLKSGGNAVIAR